MIQILKKILQGHKNTDDKKDTAVKMKVDFVHEAEFKKSLDALYYVIKDHKITDYEKLTVIDIMLNNIKKDIQNFYATKLLYCYDKNIGCMEEAERKYTVLPDRYLDYSGYTETIRKYGKKKIYFASDTVVSMPWNIQRYESAVINISRNVFKHDKINHFATYYKGLDITFMENGYHSSFAGIAFKKGGIEADVINVEKLFDFIDIDSNLMYFDIRSKTVLSDKVDFRIALLYKISKIRYEMIKKIKKKEKYIKNNDSEIFFIGSCCYEIKINIQETDDTVKMEFIIYNGIVNDFETKSTAIAKSKVEILKAYKFLNISEFVYFEKNTSDNLIMDRLLAEITDKGMYYGAKSLELQINYNNDNLKEIIHFCLRNDLQYFVENKSIIGIKKLPEKKSLRDIIMND